MALRVVGRLAGPFRAINQFLLDVVADGPPRQFGQSAISSSVKVLGALMSYIYTSSGVIFKWLELFGPPLRAPGRNRLLSWGRPRVGR